MNFNVTLQDLLGTQNFNRRAAASNLRLTAAIQIVLDGVPISYAVAVKLIHKADCIAWFVLRLINTRLIILLLCYYFLLRKPEISTGVLKQLHFTSTAAQLKLPFVNAG